MRLALIVLFAFTLCYHSCSSIVSLSKSCSVTECIHNENSDIASAILCNNCLRKISTENDAIVSLMHTLQQKLKNKDNIFGGKHLPNLNIDVLLLIFDELNIVDMMNLLKVYRSNTLFTVARNSFWRRFKDHYVMIEPTKDVDNILVFNVASKRIEVGTKILGKKILKYFGSVIQHLVLDFNMYELAGYVNRYACNSLIKLQMDYINLETFKCFKLPFNRLEELEFKVSGNINTGNLTFQQMFPQLKKLKIGKLCSFYTVELPYLQHLEIHMYSNKLPKFEEMLRKNPQLQSLQIHDDFTRDTCNVISKHALNLRNLSASQVNGIDEAVRFENVKQFEIRSYTYQSIQYLSFPQLESLILILGSTELSGNHSLIWIEFVRRHSNLRILKIDNSLRLKNLKVLMPLLNELPRLIELTLVHYEPNPETLFEIIQNHSNIVKMNFMELTVWHEDVNVFRERFENNWIINVDRANAPRANLHFEKIN